MYGTMKMVTRKAAQMGHVLPRRTPTGEVLSVVRRRLRRVRRADRDRVPRRLGALVAYLVVAGHRARHLAASSASWCWSPRRCWCCAALPLLRPLHRRQEIERTRNSDLTSMATDIVAGLRILRGIGGERTFGRNYAGQSQLARQAGVSAGIWQAAIEAVGVLFSGRVPRAADLARRPGGGLPASCSVGQLISFLGLRAVHGLPDPDLLRARPEVAPGRWSRRARRSRSSSSSRRGPTRPSRRCHCPHDADLYDERPGSSARPAS